MKQLIPVASGALAAVWMPALAMAQPRDWGPPPWAGHGGIFHMFFELLMLLVVLAVIIGLVVLGVRWLSGPGRHLMGQGEPRKPLDILKERLARGEIDVAEYEERKRALAE